MENTGLNPQENQAQAQAQTQIHPPGHVISPSNPSAVPQAPITPPDPNAVTQPMATPVDVNQAVQPVTMPNTPPTPTVVEPHASVVMPQPTVSATPEAPVPAKKNKILKFKLVAAVLLVLVLLGIGGGVYAAFLQKTSPQTVAQEFVTAMNDHNKAKVESLLSHVTNSNEIKEADKFYGTTDYYTICEDKIGVLCTYYFTPKFIKGTTVSVKNYYDKTLNQEEKEVSYAVKDTQSNGKNCNSSSTSSLDIYLTPKGRSWLVVDAEANSGFSGNLCFSGSTNTTSN